MARAFSVGELSWSACVGAKQYPPPGIMTSRVCRQSATTSSTVPKATGPAVLMHPWNASLSPYRFLRYSGDMSTASGCSVSTASMPISMNSS